MPESALTAAQAVLPLIEELRDDTESDRAIAAPIVDELKTTKLARMMLLESNAGLETNCAEALGVFEVLAGAEASVAWVVWNNSLPCWYSRCLGPAVRDEIFADPSWWYANSTRPQGLAQTEGDGYHVKGQWSLVSGCEQAEWIQLLCAVVDE